MSERSDAQLHQRACEVMARVVELSAARQDDVLASECGDDVELRALVERLLRHHCDSPDGSEPSGLFASAVGASLAVGAGVPSSTGSPIETIGPFRIVRELGRGGMGVVYEAEQSLPRRHVALKVFHSGWREFVGWSRFERETAALARLRHPGIAALYEVGVSESAGGSLPWFAMELVPGERLDEYVRRHALDRARRLQLLVQVCDAIDEAHRHGVVHRDLKPANLLVEPGDRVRVVDFGVAHVADAAAETRATTIGELLGTLAYMSPEQAIGDARRVDARADVYSLGVLLYELLAGRLPLPLADRPVAAAARLLAEVEPPRLSLLDPTLAGDLENVVAKALEKEPERRYATAGELADDLRRHLDHRPVLARPPSLRVRAAKFARRNRPLVVGATVGLVALVGGVVALAVGWSKATNALAESERRRRAAINLVLDDVRAVREMGDFSGAAPLRQQALERTARFIEEQRLPDAADAWDLSAMEALASFREAESDLLVHEARRDEALIQANEAVALRRRLAARRPERADWRAALSIAEVIAGDLADEPGDLEAARARLLDWLPRTSALVEQWPDDQRLRDVLAQHYDRLSEIESTLHHYVAADEFERHWLSTCEEFVRRDPENRRANLSLVRAHVARFDRIAASSGALAAAEHADEALRIVEPLSTASPGDVELTRAHVAALRPSFVVAMERKDLKTALAIAQDRVNLSRRLVDENPGRHDVYDERNAAAYDLCTVWARRRQTTELWRMCDRAVSTIDREQGATRVARQIAADLELLWGRSQHDANAEDGGLEHFKAGLRRLGELDQEQRNDRRVVRSLVFALLDPNFPECTDARRAVQLADDFCAAAPEEPAAWVLGAAQRVGPSLATVAVELADVVERRCTHLGDGERAALAALRTPAPQAGEPPR